MTRINPLPLHCLGVLSTEHLNAAWKETPRIVTRVEKLQEQGKTPDDVDIPDKFTFNSGHEKFFYNKLTFIAHYYEAVQSEGIKRNFNYSYSNVVDLDRRIALLERHWRNDWMPDHNDVYLGMARLVERNFSTFMKVVGREVIG